MNAEAHVWLVDAGALAAEELERCRSLLSPGERARMERFRFAPDRDAYAAAHALVRLALSWCDGGVAPREWTFEATQNGRPEVANRARLRFNLSHTRGLVACVVTEELACGIDVEAAYRGGDLLELARTVLAPAELARLAAAPPAERPHLFCRYWTAKEAYAKALGMGLSLPFTTIALAVDGDSVDLPAEPGAWHFEQWSPAAAHTVAVAVRREGREVRVVRHGPGDGVTSAALPRTLIRTS